MQLAVISPTINTGGVIRVGDISLLTQKVYYTETLHLVSVGGFVEVLLRYLYEHVGLTQVLLKHQTN